jgi:hypothetical protein
MKTKSPQLELGLGGDIPSWRWSPETKLPETLTRCMCAGCERIPETVPHLPDGWCWDTMEPDNNWAWCPECMEDWGWSKQISDEKP